jgi:hypothetical protein
LLAASERLHINPNHMGSPIEPEPDGDGLSI